MKVNKKPAVQQTAITGIIPTLKHNKASNVEALTKVSSRFPRHFTGWARCRFPKCILFNFPVTLCRISALGR